MTITITHPFVSPKTDGADATQIQPSNWNAGHTLTLATGKLIGRTTAGTGTAEEIDIGAWTSYTPTMAAGTGSFTSAAATGAYKQIGKTVHFMVRTTITTNGTAASFMLVGLPVASSVNQQCFPAVDEGTSTALTTLLYPPASTTAFRIYTSAYGYPGADLKTFIVSGTYEAA